MRKVLIAARCTCSPIEMLCLVLRYPVSEASEIRLASYGVHAPTGRCVLSREIAVHRTRAAVPFALWPATRTSRADLRLAPMSRVVSRLTLDSVDEQGPGPHRSRQGRAQRVGKAVDQDGPGRRRRRHDAR